MGPKRRIFKNWEIFLSVSAYILVNAAWLAGTWPGVFVQDASDTWQQMVSGRINDWHPVANIIYMKFLSVNGRFPFLISIFQQIIFLALILKMLKLIYKEMSLEHRIMMATLMSATPFFGPMLVTPVKDLPYSLFTLFGICFFASSRKSKRQLIKGTSLTLLGALFRHESILTLLIFSCALLSAKIVFAKCFKTRNKMITFALPLALILCVFTTLTIDKAIHSSIKVESAPSWWKFAPLLADIAYVLNSDPSFASSETGKQASHYFGKKFPLGAERCSNPGLLLNSSLEKDYSEINVSRIPEIWLKIMASGNRHLIESHICRGIPFIPPPFATFPDYKTSWKYTVWTSYGSWHGDPTFSRPSNPVTKSIFDTLDTWRRAWNFLGRFIAWPGLHLSFILSAGYFAYRRRIVSVYPLLLLSIFCASRLASLVLYTGGPDYRYAFTVHIVSACVLASIIYHQCFRNRLEKTLE